MSDGRKTNGGKRKGAGRKPKRDEDDLQKLLKKCVAKADREAMFKQLAIDTKSPVFKIRNESRKLLISYLYGKPTERRTQDEESDGLTDLENAVLSNPERARRIIAILDAARARRAGQSD